MRTPRRQTGFTLLEILVVVMLIGIILSVAVLSVGGSRSEAVATEARRMLALFTLAQEEAVLNQRQLAARILPDGYRFEALADRQWQPVQDNRALRQRRFPEEMTIRLLQDEQPVSLDDAENPARILFAPSGETVPFVLELGWSFEDVTWRLIGEASGELRLEYAGATT